MKKLTPEIIDGHQKIAEELGAVMEDMSKDIKTMKAQNGENEAEVADIEDGEKTVSVKEKYLWQEMFHLGTQGNRAADYFRKVYPNIFKKQEKIDQLREKMANYQREHFGFDFTQITIHRIIDFIQGVMAAENKRKSLLDRILGR